MGTNGWIYIRQPNNVDLPCHSATRISNIQRDEEARRYAGGLFLPIRSMLEADFPAEGNCSNVTIRTQ